MTLHSNYTPENDVPTHIVGSRIALLRENYLASVLHVSCTEYVPFLARNLQVISLHSIKNLTRHFSLGNYSTTIIVFCYHHAYCIINISHAYILVQETFMQCLF